MTNCSEILIYGIQWAMYGFFHVNFIGPSVISHCPNVSPWEGAKKVRV